MKGGFNLFFVLVFVIIFLGGVSSAVGSCSIQLESTCTDNKEVFKISNPTNAHGELNSQENYDYVLCCNSAEVKLCNYYCSGSSQECEGKDYPTCMALGCSWKASNKIIGLSSETNAHAESPYSYNYGVDVCYGDLKCIHVRLDPRETNCAEHTNSEYPIDILSLSSSTNAHIGAYGDYDIKICCADGDVVPICGDNSCNGEETCGDTNILPECNKDCGACPVPRAYWAVQPFPNIYEEISSIKANLDETEIYLVLENSGLTEASFEIYENDPFNDDDIRIGANAITGTGDGNGKIIATWIITQEDVNNANAGGSENEYKFFFKVENERSEDLLTTIWEFICIGVTYCRDAKNSDDCTRCDGKNSDVANKSVFENNPSINCDGINYNCYCYWDGDSCEAYWDGLDPNPNPNGITKIGTCKYAEDPSDGTCEEGGIFYSWIGTWTWDVLNNNLKQLETPPTNYTDYPNPESAWHYDPIDETTGKRKNEKCGKGVMPCPAQIQLKFFTIYSLVIAIALIVLIYFLILKNSKKASKKKVKKRKINKEKK